MTPRLGMALVGLGAATQPHLRSLQDLNERIDLRYAVTRHPHPDRIRPYTGPVRWVSSLDFTQTSCIQYILQNQRCLTETVLQDHTQMQSALPGQRCQLC